MGFGVWGVEFGVLGSGVWSLGFGVWGLGCRVQGLGLRVQGSGFREQGEGFGVWCLVFGVWGLDIADIAEGDVRRCAGEMCGEPYLYGCTPPPLGPLYVPRHNPSVGS